METGSYRFPLSDEQAEAVADKTRLGIPSLNLFGSRTSPTARPSEGHLDFSPIIAPRGEELLAISDTTAKIYTELNMPLPFVAGFLFHPRAMMAFQSVATFRNAADNRRSRTLYERLLRHAPSAAGMSTERTHTFSRMHPDVRLQQRRPSSAARDAQGCDRSERNRVARTLRHLAETLAGKASMSDSSRVRHCRLPHPCAQRARSRRDFSTAAWSRTHAGRQDRGTTAERGAAVFNNWCSACHGEAR